MNDRFVDVLVPHLTFLGDRPLTEDDRLADLGLDSMHAIDLLFDLEDGLGVTLPDEELNATTFASAGTLWEAVRRTAESQGSPIDGRATA
ncbi:hypothetical protein Skr01_63890 [Sphaerisporangium krabiense]|uniref:Acyl carrier protein n=1 Tax=Sphaerisporangium krabiense TaxID=763782 RepID=A0A7W8Z6J6_9ACTN|nr:acyl carrier protein [Sphaerisporangium krabiense]MBB5628307.1 acyl carrier protein [Sphaerisporangium krabiense]GII66304.1 hypothetical protein Skr01_63890 [Sphaerisporangium krabiense]